MGAVCLEIINLPGDMQDGIYVKASGKCFLKAIFARRFVWSRYLSVPAAFCSYALMIFWTSRWRTTSCLVKKTNRMSSIP